MGRDGQRPGAELAGPIVAGRRGAGQGGGPERGDVKSRQHGVAHTRGIRFYQPAPESVQSISSGVGWRAKWWVS